MKPKLKYLRNEIHIRPLNSVFRICVSIYVDLEPTGCDIDDYINVFISDLETEDIAILNHLYCAYPRLTLYWDVGLLSKQVHKYGNKDLLKYYNKQIESTITNQAMALINLKNDDEYLRVLAKLSLYLLRK